MDLDLTFKGKNALLKVECPITTDKITELQEKLDEVLAKEVKKFEIDFSACKILCSTGIGRLLSFHKTFTTDKKEMKIIKCSATLYNIFTTIKLDRIIPTNQ
jgi:ABC-type transporter Mla MlaB component